MLYSAYTSIAGEYDGPPFCTPIGILKKMKKGIVIRYIVLYMDIQN